MPSTIPVAMVEQFSANVFLKTQQEQTKLRPTVYTESVKGRTKYTDSIGETEAQEVTTRHAKTRIVEVPHYRRQLSLRFYDWSAMIDQIDKVRMLYDPASTYVKSASAAFGRKIDSIVLESLVGTARAGQTGETSIALPENQKINLDAAFTVDSLIAIKERFDWNNVKEEEEKYIVTSPTEKKKLLSDTKVTSSDYNTIKALVKGEIDTFMGFKFITSTLVPTFNNEAGTMQRKCVAYTSDSFRLGIGINPKVRIAESSEYSFNTLVYMLMGLGGVRVEDEKVVEIDCNV